MSTRDPRSTVEMLTYAAAWFDDLDELTATFARVTGQEFEVNREIQESLLALARWMAEHSDANDDSFAYVERNTSANALSAPSGDAQGERAHGDGTAAQGSVQGESGGKR